jgi:hypothetical protein
MRLVFWIFLFGTYLVACAVDVPPPGGPVDETPPFVVTTSPVAESSGVDPGSEIGLTFSEDMTRARVERLIQFSPPIEIGSVRWDGRTIFIRPRDPLHPDTTYVVILKSGFRDNHKVASTDGTEFVFATSAAVDSGTISGRVYFRREPSSRAVVRCFVLPVDSGFKAEAARPDRETKADDDGNYALKYLPNRNNAFIVWAFEDENRNGSFAPKDEAGMTLPDTVVLVPSLPIASGKDIYIVDPKEPAVVAGVVINRSGLDTIPVSVALYADSTGVPPAYMMPCDTTGAFEFGKILRGKYILHAFIDVNPDSACGTYPCFEDSATLCVEPCAVYPDTLFVEPGSETMLDTLYLDGVK